MRYNEAPLSLQEYHQRSLEWEQQRTQSRQELTILETENKSLKDELSHIKVSSVTSAWKESRGLFVLFTTCFLLFPVPVGSAPSGEGAQGLLSGGAAPALSAGKSSEKSAHAGAGTGASPTT